MHNNALSFSLFPFTRLATKWIKVKQGHSFPCHWWMSDLFLKRLTTTEVVLSCAVFDRLQPGSQTPFYYFLSHYRFVFIDVDQLMHPWKLKLHSASLLNHGTAFHERWKYTVLHYIHCQGWQKIENVFPCI